MDDPARPGREPLSVRGLDGICLAFALWTVCCQAVVALGGTLWTLLVSVLAVGLVPAVSRRRLRALFPSTVLHSTDLNDGDGASRLPWKIRSERPVLVLGPASLAFGLGLVVFDAGTTALWWWVVLSLGAACLVVFRDPADQTARTIYRPASGRGHETLLWLLALFCAVIALIVHRPDSDDAFYVNLAVAAADRAADWALLSSDTLHGIEDLPLHLPVYRLHTYEILNGVLSYLTGIPAIYCFHWISAFVGALLLPLAWARLCRLLLPGQWLWAVAVLVLLFVAVGETHRWPGNFALVRIWQGKGIFLSVFLPLIYAYGLEFAARPVRLHGLRLAAAQIGAVGLTSSALWLGPLAAMTAVLAGSGLSWRALPRLSWATLTAMPVLLVGAVMKLQMTAQMTAIRAATASSTFMAKQGPEWAAAGPASRDVASSDMASSDALTDAVSTVWGDGRLAVWALLAVGTAWCFAPRHGPARRFAVVAPLVTALALANPYTGDLVSTHLVGPSLWRALWAMPVLLLLVMILASPLRLGRPLGPSMCVLLSLAFCLWVPGYGALTTENGVERIGRPGVKAPALEYAWAERVHRSLEPGQVVLAPRRINEWLPTFHHPAVPLRVRFYLQPPVADLETRQGLINLVEGTRPMAEASQQRLRRGLEDFDMAAVVLRSLPRHVKTRRTLREAGFRLDFEDRDYELWLRDGNAVDSGRVDSNNSGPRPQNP